MKSFIYPLFFLSIFSIQGNSKDEDRPYQSVLTYDSGKMHDQKGQKPIPIPTCYLTVIWPFVILRK